MCNQNWARLVLWLVLLSGFFLVIALAQSSEKDETFVSQFMAPSTGHVNEQMVKILSFYFTVMSDGIYLLGSQNCIGYEIL